MQKKILGLGHPRTGTGYTSKLLNLWGLDVLHEKMGSDGIVAWQFATRSKNPMPWLDKNIRFDDYSFDHIIYNVRNPFYSIPSIAQVEKPSLEYRKKFVHISNNSNPVFTAIESILLWDELILSHNVNFIYQVENQTRDLYEYLSQYYNLNPYKHFTNTKYNSRAHEGWRNIKQFVKDVPDELLIKLNTFCNTYGYTSIFDIHNKSLTKNI